MKTSIKCSSLTRDSVYIQSRIRIPSAAAPASQRGVAMVLFTIAMVVLIGMSGFALDMGHAYWNKTRLQNALDAASLSGAKTIDQYPGDIARAEAAAKDTFIRTAQGAGNQELYNTVSAGDIQVEFYSTLVPLAADFANPSSLRYVRVSVSQFDAATWFVHVLPGVADMVTVGGSALAGPSPTLGIICNVAPMMICGDLTDTTYDPESGDNTLYGYTLGQEYALKISDNTQSEVGPGNFQLINLDNSKGGNDLRYNMAGSYEACLTNAQQVGIDTKTGQNVGPVFQGLNTRWGEYKGPLNGQEELYPADQMNTCEGYTYTDYENNYTSGNACIGSWDTAGSQRAPARRVVAVPVGDCSVTVNGTSSNVPMIGFACFFLTQRANQGGDQTVYGEFIGDECNAKGVAGPDPVTGPGPYKIQLYQDPLSTDS